MSERGNAILRRCKTYHVVKTWRRELCHHGLRECIIRCLKQPENNVVCPEEYLFTLLADQMKMENWTIKQELTRTPKHCES